MASKFLKVCAALCSLFGAGAVAADTVPLVAFSEFDLPFKPADAVIAQDDSIVYAVGTWRNSGVISRHDLFGSEVSSAKLSRGEPKSITYDASRDILYVITEASDVGVVYQIKPDTLEVLNEVEIPALKAPVAYVDDMGRVMIGGISASAKSRSLHLLVDSSLSKEAQNVPQELLQAALLREPVLDMWWSGSDKRVFVNLGGQARFLAIPGNTRQPEGSFTIDSKSNDQVVPFSIAGNVRDRAACAPWVDPDLPSTFIAVNYQIGAVMLLEFDPNFGDFDVVGRGNLAQNLDRGTRFANYEGTDIMIPPMLIDASCTHSVLLIGNRYSRELDYFTRPDDLFGFEKVETIRLPRAPSFVRVSESGFTSIVGFEDTSKIAVYVLEAPLASVIETAVEEQATRSIAESDKDIARKIQRLLISAGYQIGSVDGIIGKRTMAAIEVFLSDSETEIDANDLSGIYDSMVVAAEKLNLKSK